MVITRLAKLSCTARDVPYFHEWNAVQKEVRQGDFLRLERVVRQLDAKRYPQALGFCRIECQLPDWVEIESSRPRLHVAPVAADIEHIDEGEARHLFDVLL